MPKLDNDLFKLISLRGPLDALSIDPSTTVVASVVISALKDVDVNVVTPQPEVLRIVSQFPTLGGAELEALKLNRVEDAVEAARPQTFEALSGITLEIDGQSVRLADVARAEWFAVELRSLFDSWLVWKLTRRSGPPGGRYERLLRTAHIAHRLANAADSLRGPGTIARLREALVMMPAAWRTARVRERELRVRHSTVLAGLSQVSPSDRRRRIQQKKREHRDQAIRIEAQEELQRKIVREYFSWRREELPPEERAAVSAVRFGKPVPLTDRYFERLRAHFTAYELQVFDAVLATLPGGRPGNLDDLIVVHDPVSVIIDANSSCTEIRALEEEEQEDLPVASPGEPTQLRPLVGAIGWGDLVVARERLIGYQAREIAHIENILPGESKLRRHERTRSTEEVTETETITEKETERDSQTTDRYELQNQSQRAVQESFSVEAGINTSGRYGLTHVDTSLQTGFSQSSSESRSSAQNVAREVVSRAVERTFERVRELRRITVTEQIRELNRHELDNAAPPQATEPPPEISGIYLWVEKIYEVELRHYGTRLMVEFHIPEPAVSLLEMEARALTKRRMPPFDVAPQSISSANYLCLAQRYAAQDVSPPPPQFVNVGFSWGTAPAEEADEWGEDVLSDTVAIPEGYRPVSGTAILSALKETPVFSVYMAVGGMTVIDGADETGLAVSEFQFDPSLPWPNGVPLSARAKGHFDKTMVAQIVLRCERTAEALTRWQLKTWETLRAAYETLMRKLNLQSAEQALLPSSALVSLTGRSEAENRVIETNELKKWAIKAMRLTPHNFNAIEQVGDFQEIDPLNADMQAQIVNFFEEAFEWDQMSYFFYPYYWARRESWKLRNNFASADPRHAAFLNSGAARVIVPVTPGYEARALFYLESDPGISELERLDGPQSDEVPPGSAFEDLWLELLTDRKADVARGSGTLSVAHDSASVRINDDSNWRAGDGDLGRELYIGGERYVLAAINGERELELERPYEGPNDAAAIYATGSVPYGPPWLVNVPTSLVVLDGNRARLDHIP